MVCGGGNPAIQPIRINFASLAILVDMVCGGSNPANQPMRINCGKASFLYLVIRCGEHLLPTSYR